MKLSKLFRDAVASCLWSAPVFGILWWVRLEHGRNAMYDVFAAITAWGILAALIFAFRGEGAPKEKSGLEGNTEGRKWDVWVTCEGCKDRYEFHPDRNEILNCDNCGTRIVWGGQYEQPVQVQSEEGGDE